MAIRNNTPQKEKVAIVGGGIAGVAAAWALHRSGFSVELFEKTPHLGGNAKSFAWPTDNGTTAAPVFVVAWPKGTYHNYEQLLGELGIPTTDMPISYFIRSPSGDFCQDGATELHERLARDFSRYHRMVRFIARVNRLFTPSMRRWRHASLYHFSYFNPMNLIPLCWMMALFGVSREFWERIFVPVHSSTFITVHQRSIPAVLAPLLEDIVPLESPSRMATWQQAPDAVFTRMTQDFASHVHTNCEIVSVTTSADGVELRDAGGRCFQADRIIFACDSISALTTISKPSWLQRQLLGAVKYVDDTDPTFSKAVLHGDTTVFPEEHRQRIASEFNTYAEIAEDGRLESTFVVSSHLPVLKDANRACLVTFNSRKAIQGVHKEIRLVRCNHHLCLQNLIIMMALRFIQGRNRTYYCGSFTTPEGGHDLSFLSGLVIARALGASYPFSADHVAAVTDFRQLQTLMLGTTTPLTGAETRRSQKQQAAA